MSRDARRDLLFVLIGALLVGGGLLIGILMFGGGDSVATGSAEATTASSPPSSDPGSASTSSSPTSSSSSTTVGSSTASSGATSSSSPADQTGPVISRAQSSEPGVWEVGTYAACSANPQTTQVVVDVSDPSGIDAVELTWTLDSQGQTLVMTRGADGAYWASIGPFAAATLPSGASMPVTAEVYARDGLGNEVRDLFFPFFWVNDCSDQDGPQIQLLQSTESDLWENANYGGCPTNPQTAQISAVVSDPSGLASVDLELRIGDLGWSAQMAEIAEHVYSVEIGPFHEDTLAIGGGTAIISVSVIATDSLGNGRRDTSDTLVVLHDCAI